MILFENIIPLNKGIKKMMPKAHRKLAIKFIFFKSPPSYNLFILYHKRRWKACQENQSVHVHIRGVRS